MRPEEKAANAIVAFDDVRDCDMVMEIARANAEHFLPLLRDVQSYLSLHHHSGSRDACCCIACNVDREIAALEAAKETADG